MLSMVASDIETNNHDKPIFIDGNSERFPYVLDYMRYKEISLPSYIDTKIFLKDLDYYGFENIHLQNNIKSLVIITFNIGGKQYQVSKELLNKYPMSMLYTVTVEIEASNEDTPIFIDGNSDNFAYILEYMRFQEVVLPLHIVKDSFVRDLKYYGFHNNNLKNIDTLSQKNIRQERMALIVSKCMAEILCSRKITFESMSRFMWGWNFSEVSRLEIIELGLQIIWDSQHEEHEQHRSTLTSMLSKHNTTPVWVKVGQNKLSVLPFLQVVVRDSKRYVKIFRY